jgi:hypothetical protein
LVIRIKSLQYRCFTGKNMANINESLASLMDIDGAACAAIVDSNSGMLLGSQGSGMDIMLAAAGNTEVVRAKMRTMQSLKLDDTIEDMLITLGKQFHIIRPIKAAPGLFIYLVLDKSKSNLALARHKAAGVEAELKI